MKNIEVTKLSSYHNYVNGDEMPLGFGMALAQNRDAMNYFARLPKSEQQAVIARTDNISSKKDMQAYVQELALRTEN